MTMSMPLPREYLDRIDAFGKADIAPLAGLWSMGSSPEPALYAKAANLGLTSLEVPPELGGQGFGFFVKAEVSAILAASDFGFAMSLINTHNVAVRLCLSADPATRDNYLPALLSGQLSACTALTETGVGSDVGALQTLARETSGGWLLNGEKTWIVNARHAGLAIVFAQCKAVGDRSGIGAFLVDLTADGVRRYSIDSGFSQTSIGTGGFVLDNVAVPAKNLLLEPGVAFKSILNEINGARIYVAAMCNGMLRAALTDVSAYGALRKTFGKPLMQHQSWRVALDQAESGLARSDALTRKAVTLIESGQDAQLAAMETKVDAVQTAQRHLPELLHAMGAEGLRSEYCFTRHLAALQMASLTDGATNLLRDRIIRLSSMSAEQVRD